METTAADPVAEWTWPSADAAVPVVAASECPWSSAPGDANTEAVTTSTTIGTSETRSAAGPGQAHRSWGKKATAITTANAANSRATQVMSTVDAGSA